MNKINILILVIKNLNKNEWTYGGKTKSKC